MAEVSKRSIVYDILVNTSDAQSDGKAAAATFKQFGNELEKNAGKAKRLSTQLRDMRNQLATLDEGSKEFQNLAIAAAKLEDKIGDVNRRVRNLASDSKNLDAFVSVATGIAGGFAVAQGAAALFGDENEELQKTLLKVQGSLAILNGLQQVSNTLAVESSAKSVIATKARSLYTFVTGAATAATRAFNLALVATVGGAIIAGIIALVANWEKLKNAITGANDSTKKLNEARKEGFKTISDEVTKVQVLVDEYENSNTSQERRKEIIGELKEISPSYFGQLDTEKATVDQLTEAYKRYAKALELKATADALVKKVSENNVKIFEEENKAVGENISAIEKLARHYAGVGGTAERSLAKTATATKELTAENEKLRNKIEEIGKELNELGGDPGSKALEEVARSAEEARKKANAELLAQKEYQVLLTEEGTRERLDAEIAYINLRSKIDSEAFGLTESQKNVIYQKALLERSALNKKFNEENFPEEVTQKIKFEVGDIDDEPLDTKEQDILINVSPNSKKALTEQLSSLRALQDTVSPLSAQYNDLSIQIAGVNAELDKFNATVLGGEDGDKDDENAALELNNQLTEANIELKNTQIGAAQSLFEIGGQLVDQQSQVGIAFAVFAKALAIADIFIKLQQTLAGIQVGAAPYLANPLTAVSAEALVAAQTAKATIQAGLQAATVAATLIPTFTGAQKKAEGTEYLERKGHKKGRDTIPIMANEGEAIIPTKDNAKYPGLASAWIEGELDEWIKVNYRPNIENEIKQNYTPPNIVMKAFEQAETDSTKVDYSNRFYRQLIETKTGNMINKKAINYLSSIDRKLNNSIPSRYS